MRRAIKFRAWNDETNRFCYSDDEAYLLKEYDGAIWLVEDTNFYRKGCKEYHKTSNILQQFTGLHDKHNKEIYEGDIINYKSKKEPDNLASEMWFNPNTEIVVSFENGMFINKWSSEPIHELIRPLYANETTNWYVVGNVYENDKSQEI